MDSGTFQTTTSVYGSTGKTILADTNLVFVIPRAPLRNGHFTAALTRPGGSTVRWSSTVTAPTPPLPPPVVGTAAAPDGGGDWLADAEGGVTAYGDAVNYGSMGSQPLHAPVAGIASDVATGGYCGVEAGRGPSRW